MVVDTSAILAILLQEDDAERYAGALEATDRPLIAAASVVETGMVVMARLGADARADLEDLIRQGGFRVEALTMEHALVALDAFERFGKGSGHPAGLNFGDCLVYALAKLTGQPLLYMDLRKNISDRVDNFFLEK